MIEPYFKNESVTLYHGDCLELLPQFTDTFDCSITDLPYGSTTQEWDDLLPLKPLWKEIKRLVKKNGAVCLFGSEPFSSVLRISNLDMFKYDWIWEKTKAGNFAQCRKNPMKLHEMISVFYQEFPTYNLWNLTKLEEPKKNSRKTKGANLGHCHSGSEEYYQTETGFHKSILKFSNKSGNGYSFHPTQKPIDLLEYLIKTYTNENELLLDFTAGSGSLGVACMRTNRRCVLIEKDEKYCEVAAKRLVNQTKEESEMLF